MNIEGYAVTHTQPIAWGDMDAFGHVNNVQYYRYMESARIEYLNQIHLLSQEINTVVASSQCKYLRPVFFPDTLYVGAKVVEIRNSAFRMEYYLFSRAQNNVVAMGDAVIVCVDQKEMKKVAIPVHIKEALINLEKTVGNKLN